MNWTWDHARHPAAWQEETADPHERFILIVDRMFYASAAALAISIAALLFT